MAAERDMGFKPEVVMKDKSKVDVALQILEQKKVFNPSTRKDIVEEASIEAIKAIDPAFKDATTIFETVHDRFKTAEQKTKAIEAINLLGLAVYEGITRSGNKELMGAMLMGSDSLNSVLPKSLEGVGDIVVRCLTNNPDIRGPLDQIDGQKSMLDMSDPTQARFFAEEIQRCIKELSKARPLKQRERDVIKSGVSYLSTLYEYAKRKMDVVRSIKDIIPEDLSGQLEMARERLNYIESRGLDPGNLDYMQHERELHEMATAKEVREEVRREINGRLHLYLTARLMEQAGGWLTDRPPSIFHAIEEAKKQKCLIGKKDIEFFLKGVDEHRLANGLPVAEFWNQIEDINFGDAYGRTLKTILKVITDEKHPLHKEFWSMIATNEGMEFLVSIGKLSIRDVNEINSDPVKGKAKMMQIWKGIAGIEGKDNPFIGNTLTNYEYDADYERKVDKSLQNSDSVYWGNMHNNYYIDENNIEKRAVVDRFLKLLVRKKYEADEVMLNDYQLDKGYELAWKLIYATGEDGVFNACFAGHHDWAELILSEANIADRKLKFKAVGAQNVLDAIVSFSTTWPRYLVGETMRDMKDVFGPLHAEEISIAKLRDPKMDAYFFYTSLLQTKIKPLADFFIREDYKPSDYLTGSRWRSLYDMVTKVINYGQSVLGDPETGKPIKITKENKTELMYELRLLAVKAIVSLAVADPELGWKSGDLYLLGQIVTREYVVKRDPKNRAVKKKESFIKKEDWEEIFSRALADYEKYVKPVRDHINTTYAEK